MRTSRPIEVVTVTLNAAIDRTLIVPNFSAGQVNRVQESRDRPGGKGVNVAVALAEYGKAVAVTGFLGKANAASFEALFGEKRIADYFVRAEGSTRTGLKIVDPAGHQTTDINFPGLAPTSTDLDALLRQIEELAQGDAAWFVLSGSLPPGVPTSIYQRLISLLKSRGKKVLLDTSGDPLQEALESAPTTIKPNLHELEWLVGKPLPTKAAVLDAARGLLNRNVELVVVSMDEAGALFATRSDSIFVPPVAIQVKSTVGAGDAMVAGIIAAQLQKCTLPDCARLATAFSLQHLTRGSSQNAPLETWLERVRV